MRDSYTTIIMTWCPQKKTYRHHSDTVPSLYINTTKLKHRANPEAPYFIKLYKLMGRYLTITVKISSHLEIDN
jgi:hypothetical protein